MIREYVGQFLCHIGLHKGYIECSNGWAFLYCTRCNKLTSPTPPEVTQKMYDEEGMSEYGPLEREW